VALMLMLMRGEADASARSILGTVIGIGVILAYVVEEVVWIARNQGRPCSKCGRSIRMKPFRLQQCCPNCGEMQ
jgi:hypothetical protein